MLEKKAKDMEPNQNSNKWSTIIKKKYSRQEYRRILHCERNQAIENWGIFDVSQLKESNLCLNYRHVFYTWAFELWLNIYLKNSRVVMNSVTFHFKNQNQHFKQVSYVFLSVVPFTYLLPVLWDELIVPNCSSKNLTREQEQNLIPMFIYGKPYN